ncbi:MAG: cation:proton antiporter [Actinomycetota bacterium]|nr:cation:proton antiporter [Actinomycetota bacterium]
MADSYSFAWSLLLIGLVGVAAVLSNRITERIRIPAPALVLAAAAVAVQAVPQLHSPSERSVDHLVTVALILILFDGGLHIGRKRFSAAASTITIVGVAGTFLTTAGAALFGHLVIGLDWYPAILVATAVAPTDPAVVFSVLGKRVISGRSSTVLEGESGANDPVGIALMASLLSAGGLSGAAFAHVLGEFLLQMSIGALIGLLGGGALLWFIRRVPLPSEGLYPVFTIASALALFGVAALAHGSGFLAVFIAGIYLGDARAPFKREIEQVHSAAASLGEIVAFVVLGLTVNLSDLSRSDVWLPGLALALVLTVLIRPVLVGSCLIGSGLNRGERGFIMFSGLKGAVPILLGSFLLGAHLAEADRLYGIVVVVVVFSVVVQGSLLPSVAGWLKLPMRIVEPRPWALGVRLRDEPSGTHRFTVATGSAAEGQSVAELSDSAWVSVVVRGGQLVPVTASTILQAGDQALVLAETEQLDQLAALFTADD